MSTGAGGTAAARSPGTKLAGQQANWRPADLDGTVHRLTAQGDLATGLVAVTLVERCGCRLNWPPAWRQQLAALRRHPDPDVRLAALAVATASE